MNLGNDVRRLSQTIRVPHTTCIKLRSSDLLSLLTPVPQDSRSYHNDGTIADLAAVTNMHAADSSTWVSGILPLHPRLQLLCNSQVLFAMMDGLTQPVSTSELNSIAKSAERSLKFIELWKLLGYECHAEKSSLILSDLLKLLPLRHKQHCPGCTDTGSGILSSHRHECEDRRRWFCLHHRCH